MARASSPAPSTTVSLASEASWDSYLRTDKSTTTPRDNILHDEEDREENAWKIEPVGSPASVNKYNVLSRPEDPAETVFEGSKFIDSSTSPAMFSEAAVDPKFYFTDSNITVQAEESLFRVHEYKLLEFQNLKPLIGLAHTDSEGRKVVRLGETAEDVRNTFTVLYSSTYARQSFDAATFKSTLRLSTLYNHDELRTTAIGELEKFALPPIERFALSRDFGVESWMSKALDDLCQREEPITMEEGEVLGMKKFTEVATRREERISRSRLLTTVINPVLNVAKAAKQIAISSVPTYTPKDSPSAAASNAATTSDPAATKATPGHLGPGPTAPCSAPAPVSSAVPAWLSSSRSALAGVTSISTSSFGLKPPGPNSSWWNPLGGNKPQK